MRYSVYNSIISVTDTSMLLYNALTDRYMIVNNEHASLLELSPDKLESSHERYFNDLKKNGFIIDDGTDEIEYAVSEGIINCNGKRDSFQIIVNPTMRCNFRCWYCYEKHDGETKMKPATIEKVKRLISDTVARPGLKEFDLSFFGGEPLLYYQDCVAPLVNSLREYTAGNTLKKSITFTSNGFLLTDRIVSHLVAGAEEIGFQITLDGHRNLHDKVRFTHDGYGSYDRILGNVLKLLRNGIHVILRINFTAANIASTAMILDDLRQLTSDERANLSIDFQKVWQEKDSGAKAADAENIIDSFKSEFPRTDSYYHRIDSFRKPCYGDRFDSCVINYNGDVYKCTARDFTGDNRLGRLGRDGVILWDSDNILRERVERKFSNTTCQRCRIFPLCGGGCVQTSSDAGFKGCILSHTSEDKDRIVLSRFYDRITPHDGTEN